MQITTDGHAVRDAKVIRAAKILAPFAEANVRTWKFADHSPTTFTVTYVYTFEGNYKQDPVTKCAAKMDLPKSVTVSALNCPPYKIRRGLVKLYTQNLICMCSGASTPAVVRDNKAHFILPKALQQKRKAIVTKRAD
jgi:hypothetical protein